MNKPIRIGNLYGENRGTGFAGNIWDTEGISPALTTMGGAYLPNVDARTIGYLRF